jgi:hypothetical protein
VARRRRRTVFGEPVETIVAAFCGFQAGPVDEDGRVPFEFRGLQDHEAVSLQRAVLRAEARLLREEADRMTRPAHAPTSADDRITRALLLVARRAGEVRQREAKGRAA